MAASAVRSVLSQNNVPYSSHLLGRFPLVHQLDVVQLEIVFGRRSKLDHGLGRHLGHVAQIEPRQGVALGQVIEGRLRDEFATAEIKFHQGLNRRRRSTNLEDSRIGYPLAGGQIQMG